jgi:dienelactone hydrolase
MRIAAVMFALAAPLVMSAAEPSPIEAFLKKEIIGPRTALTETQEFLDARIPRLPAAKSAEEWTREAQRMREKILKDVVFRGEAAKWRDAKCKVEMLETVPGTEGYTLKKVRYEILPGFWIPALLYEPDKLSGKVPVMMAVNGHDGKGKAADYKQTRCINLAKRGMIVLNVEWLGMGQLNAPGNAHGVMNQLNLCGTSGLAPFYLSMSRGLDLLLAHPNADPKRVAVSGLSGGGWQTIFISALDTRVTLTNPVAGYSSFRTRIEHHKDLGDSEQTPCDLATIADYTHLTAMMAPRPTLLTFNAKDNCCFEAGYALPPLRDGALPFFKLYGAEKNLRTHVNEIPGDHNFGKENREALYKMIGDHFFPDDKKFSAEEIECKKEIKTKDELTVKLPDDNLTMNALAKSLMKELPRNPELPKEKVEFWRKEQVAALGQVTRFMHMMNGAAPAPKKEEKDGIVAKHWTMTINNSWSLPFVELTKGEPKGTTIVINDAGRAASATRVDELLKAGQRVVVADLFYFGEAKPNPKDWLWALMLDTLSERPLGVQAGQLAILAGWAGDIKANEKPVAICAIGPRSSTIALTAGALEAVMIASLELHNPLGSFKEIIDENRVVANTPELFCFGLLEQFDVKQLAALVAPRPIKIVNPSERLKKEFADLKDWYKLLGKDFDPLK